MWDVRTVPVLLPGSSHSECLAENTVWIRHVMYLWSMLASWAFSQFGSALLLPAAGPLISHVLDPKPEALRQQLYISLFLFYLFFILCSLFPLPDTQSGCWQRVVIAGKKHRHSTLFQTPSPTLEDIRGHEILGLLITKFFRKMVKIIKKTPYRHHLICQTVNITHWGNMQTHFPVWSCGIWCKVHWSQQNLMHVIIAMFGESTHTNCSTELNTSCALVLSCLHITHTSN